MSTSSQLSSTNTTRQTFCEVCQDTAECEFRKYFNRLQSSDADWRQETKPDRRRYYNPEMKSEMSRLRHLAQETEILDRARPQHIAKMTAEEREIQNRNFARVVDCHQTRRKLEQDHFHRPGTYIFKLRYGMGTDHDTFMGAAGNVTIGDFEYMGQVPRHRSVYGFRGRALLSDALRLFVSELRELHTLSDPDQEPEPQGPDPAEMLFIEAYTKAWELWKDFSDRSEGLGWLLNSNTHLIPRNDGRQALEELMVSATGTNLSNLATCWDAKERAAALSMLKSGDPNLMIYIPTPDTEDIHNFYSQERFDGDPLNPEVQFLFAELESPPVTAQSNSAPSGNPDPSSS
ncbi:hypothetical protein NW752_007793 [Fusarium irregulare]|uniref:Uncharacterized protein n=1 Tax=Fusarium irregulare TaxID=2494466 RepID=A0A9W8U6D1_9HYPO|nr:hypothetical protein NW766_009907 [Fusarium irregulare]KAJ4013492.1 hypothetical protein NW752_007793 [Fusarium irregulare]